MGGSLTTPEEDTRKTARPVHPSTGAPVVYDFGVLVSDRGGVWFLVTDRAPPRRPPLIALTYLAGLIVALDPMNHFAASMMTPELACILDTTEICWGMVVIEEDSLWVDSLGVHFIGRLDYYPNENWGRTDAPEPPSIQ